MSDNHEPDRQKPEDSEEAEREMPQTLLKTPTKKPVEAQKTTSSGDSGESEKSAPAADNLIDIADAESDNDIEEIVMPAVTSSEEVLRTPTKQATRADPETPRAGEEHEELDPSNVEKVFSSFPCQVIPETLTRLTRTPPEGEHLEVHKNRNGRLRIYVRDHFTKFSPYSNANHKPCTVCNRSMKSGEMHLNFPADLDRRRIWANLLGFKYKDILRSKMGPVSFSIAAGPICTEHFAEECFRNHNFNKAAIEAFGVPVAISPDVKTTPSKKRVPWVCTICDFHSCSVVELQGHLLDHTEQMLKKKDSIMDFQVPEAGFMCPFCRKCTYGYKTISGYRRHLNAAPIHHCHLRRIYEFAKMNCRSSELDPVEKWDNWTRRNVYVAYHGCEPPANEVVLTPSPTKNCNPEERTRQVHDDEKRRKAVRSLAFVGKEGGTSVNDHNVMQRAVYLQVRRNLEHKKRYPGLDDDDEVEILESRDMTEKQRLVEKSQEPEDEQEEEEESGESVGSSRQSSQVPMGSSRSFKTRRLAASAVSSPVKKIVKTTASLPTTPAKKKRKLPSEEPESTSDCTPLDAEERARQEKIRDEEFAKMVQKRSQQLKRLIHAKQFKKEASKKPRKALAYNLPKGITSPESSRIEGSSEVDEEESATEMTPEPSIKKVVTEAPSPSAADICAPKPKEPSPKPVEVTEKEEERPLKSMLARSFAAGERPSMAQYHLPIRDFSSGPLTGRSVSAGIIASSSSSSALSSPARRVLGASGPSSSSPSAHELVSTVSAQDKLPAKRPSVLSRRPTILSPRKRPAPSFTPSVPVPPSMRLPLNHHESSPMNPPVIIDSSEMQLLIPGKDIDVELVEEVIEEMATSEDVTSFSTSSEPKPMMTLAEALGSASSGSAVKDQELEEISKEMTKETTYSRCMEDAFKFRTVSKMRADMRISRHCIRQIEAARARARLFGEGEDNVHIYYSDDGAQVVSKNDPKWRELQQQQQQQQQEVVDLEEVSSSQDRNLHHQH